MKAEQKQGEKKIGRREERKEWLNIIKKRSNSNW